MADLPVAVSRFKDCIIGRWIQVPLTYSHGDSDLEQLAYEIAALGSATTDPITAPLLIELADRLLTHLGFPPERRAD